MWLVIYLLRIIQEMRGGLSALPFVSNLHRQRTNWLSEPGRTSVISEASRTSSFFALVSLIVPKKRQNLHIFDWNLISFIFTSYLFMPVVSMVF